MLSYYLIGFKKLLHIGKKIFLVLAVYFIVVSLFLHFITKDKPKTTYDPIKKNREEIYKTINDPQLNKTEEGKLAIVFYRAMMCGLIGEACTDNPADGDKNFSHSLFGFMTNLLVLPYANPPASGVYWAYSGLQNAGFIPKTYAAEGIGFAAIKPLMSIWKVFRDLAYMILVLVLIAIGFMIMFRAKINPQTVISVENSLPKIVIALLLITFSFPTAGFLIDLMYITIGIIAVLFSNATGIGENLNTPTKILNYFYFSNSSNIWNFTDPINNIGNLWNLSGAIFGILPTVLRDILNIIVLIVFEPTKIISMILNAKFHRVSRLPPILSLLKKLPQFESKIIEIKTIGIDIVISVFLLILDFILISFYTSIAGVLIILAILFLSLIFIFLRIFFMLLYAYIQIILLIAFSPVILAVEMIPGKSTFSSWVKNLLINLATWPILIILLLIVQILLNQDSAQYNNLWAPPFLLSINPQYFKIIIIMGILFMTPDLIKTIKNLTGIKPLPLDLNLGAFTAGAGATFGGIVGPLSTYTSISQAFSTGPLQWLLKRKSVQETAQISAEATKNAPPTQPQG